MAGFSKMIDMAHTQAEAKEEAEKSAVPSPGMPAPKWPMYPYGLCLSLDDDSLEKLGLGGDLPDVGDVLHFAAFARVTNASVREEIDTKTGEKTPCRRVELQIFQMAVQDEDREVGEKGWYGGDEEVGEPAAAHAGNGENEKEETA